VRPPQCRNWTEQRASFPCPMDGSSARNPCCERMTHTTQVTVCGGQENKKPMTDGYVTRGTCLHESCARFSMARQARHLLVPVELSWRTCNASDESLCTCAFACNLLRGDCLMKSVGERGVWEAKVYVCVNNERTCESRSARHARAFGRGSGK